MRPDLAADLAEFEPRLPYARRGRTARKRRRYGDAPNWHGSALDVPTGAELDRWRLTSPDVSTVRAERLA